MSPGELHEGIDPQELRSLAAPDPLPHAFALYDLDHYPDRIRFVSVREGGRLLAYLLIWYGEPGNPVVHWVGRAHPHLLVRGLPAPPFVALVPPEVAATVGAAVSARGKHGVLVMRRRLAAGPAPDPTVREGDLVARRLTPEDRPAVERFAEEHDEDAFLRSFRDVDLQRRRMYGAVSEDDPPRLLSCARTSVELPALWVIGGVYTEPRARGRGLAQAVVGALVAEAATAGADAALYVREDNGAALRTYRSLAFRDEFRTVWIDAGGGAPP